MSRPVHRIALALVLACFVGATAGCKSVKEAYAYTLLTGETLTYEQYLAIDQDANPPPTADEVIELLGKPAGVTDIDGVKRRLDYWAFSFNDALKRAEFHFDKHSRLVKKEMW